jgi:hypothetical protein
MLGKIGGLSPRMKWIAGCSTALVVFAGIALVAVLAGNGGSSISDGMPCAQWSRAGGASSQEQDAYLEGKLGAMEPAGDKSLTYWTGMQVECQNSSGTVGDAFARTQEIVAAYGLSEAQREFNLAVTTGIAP